MTVPIPRLNEMLHENQGLIIDKIYPRLFREYYLNEHKKAREGARKVLLRILILGSIKKEKDAIYIP